MKLVSTLGLPKSWGEVEPSCQLLSHPVAAATISICCVPVCHIPGHIRYTVYQPHFGHGQLDGGVIRCIQYVFDVVILVTHASPNHDSPWHAYPATLGPLAGLPRLRL